MIFITPLPGNKTRHLAHTSKNEQARGSMLLGKRKAAAETSINNLVSSLPTRRFYGDGDGQLLPLTNFWMHSFALLTE